MSPLARLKHAAAHKRFWYALGRHFFEGVGVQGVVIGILAASFPSALPDVAWPTLVIVVVVSLGYSIWVSWPREVVGQFDAPKTAIHLVVGDLFDQPGSIVIGMCDTFDTLPPRIIQAGSIQGQLLSRIFGGDVEGLDRKLDEALSGVVPIGRFSPDDGKPGKQIRYPLGTVATVADETGRLFFCVAYTEMSRRNEARATIDGIWTSLSRLWDEVRAVGNGEPVSIAVIGGGQARISQQFPARDSIRLIAMSYMFASRKERVTSRLNIVVQPQDVDRLDLAEFQAFLRTLA